jgi:hypothetical protein
MLSLIEVKCPHCGAQGQIMLPPLGAIIIGPCPECEGMVVVFCGRVLPLDKEAMVHGSLEEKRDHLLEVLNDFLKDRIERLFEQAQNVEEEAEEVEPDDLEEVSAGFAAESADTSTQEPARRTFGKKIVVPISEDEVSSFVNVDLKLLDNRDYFKAVFE